MASLKGLIRTFFYGKIHGRGMNAARQSCEHFSVYGGLIGHEIFKTDSDILLIATY